MQSFTISHSSCAEQYGDMILNIVTKYNWVTGSPPKCDTLLAVWYRTYLQSFIISHSSCIEQYGDMSPDTHTHTHTQLNLIGSLGHHQNLTHCWQYGTDIHAKFHNQPFIMRRAILMILPGHTHARTHTIKVLQLAVQQVGHTSITLNINFTPLTQCHLVSKHECICTV